MHTYTGVVSPVCTPLTENGDEDVTGFGRLNQQHFSNSILWLSNNRKKNLPKKKTNLPGRPTFTRLSFLANFFAQF